MITDLTSEMIEELCCYGDVCGFDTIDHGQWELGHKCEHRDVIVLHDGKHYCLPVSHEGDEWEFPTLRDIYEVKRVQKIVEVWEKV